jgi:hypothetical protein
MNIPKINVKRLAVALGALALAGGAAAVMAPAASASAPPAAHGGPAATQSKVGYSRGFHIYNYTSAPITLTTITGDRNFEGRPADGSVINPGSYQDIEVQVKAMDPQEDTAYYSDGAQVEMHVDGFGGPYITNFPSAGVYGSTDYLTNAYLYDSPGTVNNLGPDQKQAQADALNQLCNAGAASCQFTPTARAHIRSDPRPFGEAVGNPCDYDETFTVEAEDEVGESDSVGVELTVGVGIEEIASAEITAKYEHEWTHSHKFAQTEELKVQPHTTAWYTHEAPTIRDTGNFTVTLGNTTWNLTGVYFDTPDLTDQAQIGLYTPVVKNGATGTCPNPNPPANS